MVELLIGAPVLDRAWVLPSWFISAELAARVAGMEPEYAFVGDPEADPDTWAVIEGQGRAVHRVVAPDTRGTDERVWNRVRFDRMAYLRNQLLDQVRKVAPRWFLSLDSDVLLHPDGLADLVETAESPRGFGAVGGKCFLGAKPRPRPSYGMLVDGRLGDRPDLCGVFRVDVVMAIVLMGPSAYAVNYEPHNSGEDIGWSLAARRAGIRLGFDGRVTSRHVMGRDEFAGFDPASGGFEAFEAFREAQR